MYLQWLLQREEVLMLFLQRGDNGSSWIMSYWHSVALPFASCNLFINTKSYECLAIPLAPGLAHTGRAQEIDDVCWCLLSVASTNSWWRQFQPSENTTEGFHFFASGKSSSCYLLSLVVDYATDSVLNQWRSSLYSLLAGCYWTLTVSRGAGLSLAGIYFSNTHFLLLEPVQWLLTGSYYMFSPSPEQFCSCWYFWAFFMVSFALSQSFK